MDFSSRFARNEETEAALALFRAQIAELATFIMSAKLGSEADTAAFNLAEIADLVHTQVRTNSGSFVDRVITDAESVSNNLTRQFLKREGRIPENAWFDITPRSVRDMQPAVNSFAAREATCISSITAVLHEAEQALRSVPDSEIKKQHQERLSAIQNDPMLLVNVHTRMQSHTLPLSA